MDNWYYLDPVNGHMRPGWVQVDQKWYYLEPVNGRMVTGWKQLYGEWYYLYPSSGAMMTGWVWIDNRWYYFHDDGRMARDEWVTDNYGEPYFFTPSGGYVRWSTLPKGGKEFSMESGRSLVYDVYSTTYGGKGFKIEERNGKKYLIFQGWAIIFGHKPHNASNNSTYIIAQNVNDPNKIYGYNTRQLAYSATEDVEYNKFLSDSTTVWNECAPGVINKNNEECNMRYDNVGWEVSIPLDDLITDQWKEEKWKLYIVKRVDDTVLWDFLRLPFTLEPQNYKQGTIDLKSEVNANILTMNGTNVIKRKYAHQQEGTGTTLGFFVTGQDYTNVASDESGTTVWYGVYDPASGETRWASSTYWKFGGSQAVIKYTPIPKPPVVKFSVSPTPLYNDTTGQMTNTSYDPAGEPLTYIWWYQKPNSTEWVQFSTEKDPQLLMNQKGDWRIYLRAINTRGEYSDLEKIVTVVNRSPTADFIYTPSKITTTTNVTFDAVASDPDPRYTHLYLVVSKTKLINMG